MWPKAVEKGGKQASGQDSDPPFVDLHAMSKLVDRCTVFVRPLLNWA